ncbi:MAG: hypothetical protein V2J26_04700, partial [Pacificimonas sp.]|nr:hypothetical protein [Pacificimonas sp.]
MGLRNLAAPPVGPALAASFGPAFSAAFGPAFRAFRAPLCPGFGGRPRLLLDLGLARHVRPRLIADAGADGLLRA